MTRSMLLAIVLCCATMGTIACAGSTGQDREIASPENIGPASAVPPPTLPSDATLAPDASSALGALSALSPVSGTAEGLGRNMSTIGLLAALSLGPAVLLVTTSYVRISVVLNLLRIALGGQQVPPQSVITALSVLLTISVMAPVWRDVYRTLPTGEGGIAKADWSTAIPRAIQPVRQFMSRQIDQCGNGDEVWTFLQHVPVTAAPQTYDDVPLEALIPAFVISELKTAFWIGFQIYLPFLVIDLVVSSVVTAMGLSLLSPNVISLPLKLVLFVSVDGWRLVIESLLSSFV